MSRVDRRKNKGNSRLPLKILIFVVIIAVVAAAVVVVFNFLSKKTDDNVVSVSGSRNTAFFVYDKNDNSVDGIALIHTDDSSKKISMMSMPKNTMVTVSENISDMIDSSRVEVNKDIKIRDLKSYSKDGAWNATVVELENIFGVKIDGYIAVNIEGIEKAVESLGGIDFYTEKDIYVDMGKEDGVLDIEAGEHHIDGKTAGQLMKYDGSDYGIVVQEVIFKNILASVKEDKLSNKNIISEKYVNTNMDRQEALGYIEYIKNFEPKEISFVMVPGVYEERNGTLYYVYNAEGVTQMVDKYIHGKIDDTASADSKSLRIEVSNGGVTDGLAAKTRDKLVGLGYNVTGISNYTGYKQEATRIVVKQEGQGSDLVQYFEGSYVELDTNNIVSDEYDIKIILGLDEK